MNLSMQLMLVVVAACLCFSDAAPESRVGRSKQQRPTRGFKNVEMMTARGFGKRDRPPTRSERDVGHQQSSDRSNRGTPIFKSPSVGIARDFGKRTLELESEESGYFEIPKKFKPKSSLMVATGYGKRSQSTESDEADYEEGRNTRPKLRPQFKKILIARGYGKRHSKDEQDNVYGLDNFWEMLEASPEKEQDGNDEKTMDSIPMDWFVSEMLNNPEFARAAVRKFIDTNQDGVLTTEELLRNVV